VSNLQIEGVSLTSEGEEAYETVRSLFPELDDYSLLEILVDLVKKDPSLDYMRVSKIGPQALVTCHCRVCEKDIIMSLGWKGHLSWIETGLCILCKMKVKQ